jgi:CrcB protein
MLYLFVIIGGGIGALSRYLTIQVVNSITRTQFSFGSVCVNCIGALLIGFLVNFFDFDSLNQKWRLFIITGFVGGYTTFSGYSLETVQYFMNGNIKYAIINILINNVLCILFVFLGLWIYKVVILK